ncbi:MAG: decarboxylating 6-phosphogluconate dehydrogenase [Bifidobacteriaceae bacterium]|jgi:6-phosphogluconate dehydrogenase|nr:decarboxylating 6-phosphogluconate dehydrogenase [Bifidobacteriaceae bacterium]
MTDQEPTTGPTRNEAEAGRRPNPAASDKTNSSIRGHQVRLVIFMGVAGSGKTTTGKLMAGRLGWDFAEADDFHPAANRDKMASGTALTDQDRWPWLDQLRNWIKQELAAGRRGVMACSALKRTYRDRLRLPGVVFVHLTGSSQTIQPRLAERPDHFMPAKLMTSQYADLEDPSPNEDHLTVDLDLGSTAEQRVSQVIAALGLPGEPITVGMVGLGRMGANMAARLSADGHNVIGFDTNPASARQVDSLEELVAALPAPRLIWLMLPAGDATDQAINQLSRLLQAGDLVIDGGNSPYRADAGHAGALALSGVRFIDVGVSGGIAGRQNGYALMVGGDSASLEQARPLFDALKPAGGGFVHAGPVGAGHYAKMIHNGIEYGMMQALGEGYDLLHATGLIEDPDAVVRSWQQGTVIRSWLLDLLVEAVNADPDLTSYPSWAGDSGEARWMVESALDLGVPLPVTAASLYARQVSQRSDNPALRVVAALRAGFGGHTA